MKRQVRKAMRYIVGARGSRLSLAQTAGAVEFMSREFPGTEYDIRAVETPGDRDLATPIDAAPADFFTRDLDDAVKSGAVDFAIHSAKDLPPVVAEGLDWFWLPSAADRRDAWVVRHGDERTLGLIAASPVVRRRARLRIGVSGERRRAYAKSVFPNAKTPPIRGAVDSRVEQLCAGAFDAVLMACAGLDRLWPDGAPGVDALRIPLGELVPPEAQGFLAVVFRRGDERLMSMRARFTKAVRFVSAGVGDAGLCTLAGRRDIDSADVILHDDLLGRDLIDGVSARLVHVGKRCGAHSMRQDEITRLICDEARKGRRVVRLKGGDAGLFGRLAEETDALAELKIPFVVRPGVSALTAATTGTGMLLTRRGLSCGFTAYTPRSTGEETPVVAFMAAKIVRDESKRLMDAGWPRETPCALVRDAAGMREEISRSTLGAAVRGALSAADDVRPGLFIAGSPAGWLWPKLGELAGARVLATCSDDVWERARLALEDRGGRPMHWPLIELKARGEVVVDGFDAVVLTSPAAVRIFFESCRCDFRRLPQFFTCGAGTDAELRRRGIASDVVPASDFSAAGLIAEIGKLDLSGRRVLRLRSAKAGGDVARALRRAGAKVEDRILYDNVPVVHSEPPPAFDAVFFASASAAEVYLAQYGRRSLAGKAIYAMGRPTLEALPPSIRRHAVILRVWDFAL